MSRETGTIVQSESVMEIDRKLSTQIPLGARQRSAVCTDTMPSHFESPVIHIGKNEHRTQSVRQHYVLTAAHVSVVVLVREQSPDPGW